MRCAANYAWANRQCITHWVRESFCRALGKSPDKIGLQQVYDVAHNIAKIEKYQVDNKTVLSACIAKVLPGPFHRDTLRFQLNMPRLGSLFLSPEIWVVSHMCWWAHNVRWRKPLAPHVTVLAEWRADLPPNVVLEAEKF